MARFLIWAVLILSPLVLFAQYPNTPGKTRLGYGTTADGLTYRGNGAPATTPTGYRNYAYVYLDSTSGDFYAYYLSAWNRIAGVSWYDSLLIDRNVVFGGGVNPYLPLWDTDSQLGISIARQSGDSVIVIEGGLNIESVHPLGSGDSMLVWRNNKVYRRGFRQALSAYNAVSGTGLESSIPVWATDSTLGFSTWYLVSNQIGYNNLSPVYQFDMRSSTNSALGLPNVATASLPTGYSGGLLYNTTAGNLGFYGAAAWEYPVKSSTGTGLFTSGSVLFADANGRAAQDNAGLFWDDTNNELQVSSTTLARGISLTGTNYPAYSIKRSGTVKGYWTVATGSGGFLTDSQIDDMIFRAETTGKRILLGVGANPSTVRILKDEMIVYSNVDAKGISVTGSNYPAFSVLRTNVPKGYWTVSTGAGGFLADSQVDDMVLRSEATGSAILMGVGATASTLAVSNTTVGINVRSPSYTLDINSTGAMRLPRGTTAQRPTANDYILRGNSSNTKLETYYSAAWHNIATETWVTANYATPAAITWTAAADSGTPQAVTSTQTATWAGGWGINTSVGGTRTVTVEVDSSQVATQYDLTQVAQDNIYTADGTLTGSRVLSFDDNDLEFDMGDGGLYMYAYDEDGYSGSMNSTSYGPYLRAFKTGTGANFTQISIKNIPPSIQMQSGSLSGTSIRIEIDTISGFNIKKDGIPVDTLFHVKMSGQLKAGNYGSGTFTGTAAYSLAVDASGNVIEADASTWLKPELEAGNDVLIFGEGDFLIASSGGGGNKFIGISSEDQMVIIGAGTESGNNAFFGADTMGVAEVFFKNSFLVTSGDVDTVLIANADGSLAFPQYGSGTFTGTPTYTLSVDASGNVIEAAAKQPAKSFTATDTDITIASADATGYQMLMVWATMTAGATETLEITLPDPTAAMLGTMVVATMTDGSGTYNGSLSNASTLIYNAGSTVTNVAISNSATVRAIVQYNGSTYYWVIIGSY